MDEATNPSKPVGVSKPDLNRRKSWISSNQRKSKEEKRSPEASKPSPEVSPTERSPRSPQTKSPRVQNRLSVLLR